MAKEKHDEMNELYSKAKKSINENNGLKKENIIDMVNTIIRRKHLKLTVC